jgi:hypothetical protein
MGSAVVVNKKLKDVCKRRTLRPFYDAVTVSGETEENN